LTLAAGFKQKTFFGRRLMRQIFSYVLLAVVLLGSLSPIALAQKAPAQVADLVFRNGAVYTLDASRRWAEAVAVRAGRIVYVGTGQGVRSLIGPKTTVVDLQGKMLLPGFHDSHVHPVSGGIELNECQLSDLATEAEILEAVRRYAEQNPHKAWIRGSGWQLPIFPNANPNKSLLDKIVPDRPVFLSAADGHSAWVNSRALEIAKITKDTPDPKPGRIERDPATGEPAGTLREGAIGLVSRYIPKYTPEDYVNGLRRGLEMANRFGITSFQDADVGTEMLNAYATLDRQGELTARVVAAIEVDPSKGTAQVPKIVAMRKQYRGQRLRANTVKIYADGVIESHTAALLEPYLGTNGDRGKANVEPEVFNPLAAALDREGFQIHVHAIGDRAIRNTLDAFEFARTKNGARDSRHTIAHLELFNPQDVPRFRRLGVVANFQPLWAFADPYINQLTIPVLGPERSRWLYPIHSIARTGAVIACGSDWSVTSMNPLDAIQVAITRRGLDDGPGAAWIPEETVDLAEMLAGYTINGAYLNFEEKETGSIEVGKAADLIVIDHNLFEIPPHKIHEAKVLLTLLAGKEVYRDPSFTLSH
jgi:predicted amidohydrolase YtcJ